MSPEEHFELAATRALPDVRSFIEHAPPSPASKLPAVESGTKFLEHSPARSGGPVLNLADLHDLLTGDEVAEYLRVNERTLRRMVDGGTFGKPVYLGRGKSMRRFRKCDLLAYLKRIGAAA